MEASWGFLAVYIQRGGGLCTSRGRGGALYLQRGEGEGWGFVYLNCGTSSVGVGGDVLISVQPPCLSFTCSGHDCMIQQSEYRQVESICDYYNCTAAVHASKGWIHMGNNGRHVTEYFRFFSAIAQICRCMLYGPAVMELEFYSLVPCDMFNYVCLHLARVNQP